MRENRSDRNNLAIIGASGTGKTTLAVGLYATSTETFTVSPEGDETRKYLEIRKTSIEEGFWPAATNESENFDLRLRLHVSGKQTYIVFREYMGERMERDPNYIREVIGTPKSAMILFNPGMPRLSKPETRNRMLGNLKVIAQHLKDNGCIAVAFVVTASDRLTSDLSAFREDFEAYASEVTNHLTNLGLDWKRFDVTASGQLDDQNKPKLARGEDNTTHEPFLWLLKRIRDSKRRTCLLTAAAVAATIIGVSGAVFGGLVIHSRQVLTRAETAFAKTANQLNTSYAARNEADVRAKSEFFTNSFDEILAILPSDRTRKQVLIGRTKEQKDLWGVRLLKMELASNRSKIATKSLDVRLDWFDDFNKRLTASSPAFKDAVIERDTLTNEWANSRIVLETNCQTAHFCADVEKERQNLLSAKDDALSVFLKESKPLITDEKKTYPLVTNRADLCVSLGLMSARTSVIVRFVDSKIGKPEDANLPDDTKTLSQKLSNELKRGLTSAEFDTLPNVITQRCTFVRKAWEERQFPLQVQNQLDALKAASADPADALKNSRAFLESMDKLFSSIPENKRSKAKVSITNERSAAIDRYLKVKTPWEPEDDEPPADTYALQQQTRQELKSALTDTEFDTLLGKLETHRAEARKAWDAFHFPRRVNGLVTALKNSDVNPTRPLKDSLAFLVAMTNDFLTISPVEFVKARNVIEEGRKIALAAYKDSIAGIWNVNGKKPLEFGSENIRNTILTQTTVTDEEFLAFENEMNTRFNTAKREWNTNQKNLVDGFSVDGGIETVTREYGAFVEENLNNPYLNALHNRMKKRLKDYFVCYMRDYYDDFFGEDRVGDERYLSSRMERVQRKFNEFRQVCLSVNGRGWSESPLQKSEIGKFAKLCVDRGHLNTQGIKAAFEQTITIRKVEAKFAPTQLDSDYIQMIFAADLIAERWNGANDRDRIADTSVFSGKTVPRSLNNQWVELWSGTCSVPANPWTFTKFILRYEDHQDALWSNGSDKYNRWLWLDAGPNWEGEIDVSLNSGGLNTNTKGVLSLRITYDRAGPDFSSLWEEAGNM